MDATNSTDYLAPESSTGSNVSSLADALFYGVIISTALFGITIVQMWTYFNHNKDQWPIRALMYSLVGLDTATTILTAEMGHYYLIDNFGSIPNFATLPKTGIGEVGINVFAVLAVELFFASRVYLLMGRRWCLPIIITVFAVAAAVSGVFLIVDIARTPLVEHLSSTTMKWEVALTNAFYATSDIITTATMSWHFYRSKGGVKVFHRTNTLLEKLLAYTVTRGGLVTVAQILTLILYIVRPRTLDWMPVHFCLSKLYVLTMVVMLNSREDFRNILSTSITFSNEFTDSIIRRPFSDAGRIVVENSTAPASFNLTALAHPQKTKEAKSGTNGIIITQERITDMDYREDGKRLSTSTAAGESQDQDLTAVGDV